MVPKVKPSSSTLDFWGKLLEDENGKLISPGFVNYGEANANLWDLCFMNLGKGLSPLPGTVNVYFKRQKNKDKKKPVGVDSTTVTTSGIKAAEIIIELTLWTPQHWLAMKEIMPTIFPKPGKDGGKQNSYQVSHPLLNVANIKAVVFTGFEGPLAGHVNRAKTLKLECVEWMPTQTSKKAGGTAPPPSLAKEVSEATIGLQSNYTPPGESMCRQVDLNQSISQ